MQGVGDWARLLSTALAFAGAASAGNCGPRPSKSGASWVIGSVSGSPSGVPTGGWTSEAHGHHPNGLRTGQCYTAYSSKYSGIVVTSTDTVTSTVTSTETDTTTPTVTLTPPPSFTTSTVTSTVTTTTSLSEVTVRPIPTLGGFLDRLQLTGSPGHDNHYLDRDRHRHHRSADIHDYRYHYHHFLNYGYYWDIDGPYVVRLPAHPEHAT